MSFQTPRTWQTDDVATEDILNQEIRDNINAIVPNGPDAWVAYTPTLTQNAAVTKTVTSARYMKVGRMVTVEVLLTVTGTGTANERIELGLPLAAATPIGRRGGTLTVTNDSGPNNFVGAAELISTTVVACVTNNNSNYLGEASSAFDQALAADDLVTLNLTYEAAA